MNFEELGICNSRRPAKVSYCIFMSTIKRAGKTKIDWKNPFFYNCYLPLENLEKPMPLLAQKINTRQISKSV